MSNTSALIPSRLARTPHLTEAILTTRGVINQDGIMTIDGVPGTGKTTCAAWVAENLERPAAMIRMSNKPAPLELLRRTHDAIGATPLHPRATRFDLQNALLPTLREWRGVLIVDELQHTAPDALQELVWLYEESDRAFAVVAVGTDVLPTIQVRYPQLHSRVMGSHTFRPLTGKALIEAVQEMDPRLAKTPIPVLAEHDQEACAGLLRRWVLTCEWLNALQITGPVTQEILHAITTRLPAQNAPTERRIA